MAKKLLKSLSLFTQHHVVPEVAERMSFGSCIHRDIPLCLVMVKTTARPITVWKGNSMMTIAVRDPQISGKDSGKGDSDVNDSDSDISEGLKKDYTSYKG